MRLYIFGPGCARFEDFVKLYAEPLWLLPYEDDESFIVCDFRGVDTLVMELLKTRTTRVSVYHIGERPRYLPDRYRTKVSSWQLEGGFATDEARDDAAIEACTHFLAYTHPSARESSGTKRNIKRCLELGRYPLVPYDQDVRWDSEVALECRAKELREWKDIVEEAKYESWESFLDRLLGMRAIPPESVAVPLRRALFLFLVSEDLSILRHNILDEALVKTLRGLVWIGKDIETLLQHAEVGC